MIHKIEQIVERVVRSKTIFGLAILFTLFVTYILNNLYPIAFDDWMYTFVFGTDELVENIGDIARSQYTHYFMWGGRSVVHSVAQFLLMLPPVLHNLLNAAILTSLLLLFYKIANYQKRINLSIFLIIGLMMWYLQPAFASVYFWITGSANYLWGTLIVMLFLYPYYTYYRNGTDSRGGIIGAIAFFIFGIIAGWTNENMPFAMGIFILFFFYLLNKNKQRVPYWAILGFVGMIVGAFIMLKAPGNYVRLDGQTAGEGLTINYLLSNIPNMLFLYLKRIFLPLMIPYLIVFYLYRKSSQTEKSYKTILNSSLMFLLAGHLSYAALVGADDIPNRALFGTICFVLVALCILIANITSMGSKIKSLLTILLLFAFLSFCIDYYSKYKTYLFVQSVYKERESIIEEGKKKGQRDFVFYNKFSKIAGKVFYGDGDHPENPNYFLNEWYAKYFGINSVRIYDIEEKETNQTLEEK